MKYIIDDTMSINSILKNCKDGDCIFIKNGIYKEKIEIFNNNIQIEGESAEKTIITNMDYFHKIMPDYNECSTFRSYTTLVVGNNVTISNLSIINSSSPSKTYGQAVALSVLGNNFNCTNCILKSAQDTLFTGPMPKNIIERYSNTYYPDYLLSDKNSKQIYTNCKIYGDVDFIFGGATVLFSNCDIIVIEREKNNQGEANTFISAPSHEKDIPFGYLFHKCNIICEGNIAGVYLSRPWRDYGCAAYIDCNMTNQINPLGFNKWNNTDRDKTARYYEYTEKVDLSKREPWVNILSRKDADNYVEEFLEYMKEQ